jgi:hypothetical protein
MQKTLTYNNNTDQTGNAPNIIQYSYLNVARDLSRVNSKNEEVTTRDGHVFGYLLKMKVNMTGGDGMSVSTAPNSWRMRNAFRKWHAYRDMMFEEQGIEGDEKGRYGQTIRPLLDALHIGNNTDTLVPMTSPSSIAVTDLNLFYDKGEWSYSNIAVTPTYSDGPVPQASIEPWADTFALQICEETKSQLPPSGESSGTYSRVGMIQAYNQDRMEVPDIFVEEALTSPNNPLAQIRSNGNQAAGAVLDIAIDQELEEPPYDRLPDGMSIQTSIQGFSAIPTTGGTTSFVVFAPAGLLRLNLTNEDVLASIEVEVLDKVLCKDMS